jgi:putative DNA-invertase from lambdoid prophage Rac
MLDKPRLGLTTPLGPGFIAFLSAMVEDERLRVLNRCNGGMATAKPEGIKLGRKPNLSEHQRQTARRRLEASARSIARDLGVHHTKVIGAA